ncbi:unnamed protein product [Amaranthus hypochondriacus]
MEESEKRRERLKAMRLEATSEVVSSSTSSSFSQQTLSSPLANPLLDNFDSNVAATPPPRFDFYTDPMAAYATDKRRPFVPRPNFSPSYGARGHPETPLSGANQFQNNYVPPQGMYRGGALYHSPGRGSPTSSPMGWSRHPVQQGNPDFRTAPGRGPYLNNTPGPGSYGSSPNSGYQGSPNFRSPTPGRGHWSTNSPCPSPGRGDGPSRGLGRGNMHWNGRGISPGIGYSGGRGQGRGRGRGYHDGPSRPFYNNSMVEDPWKFLTPVFWKGDEHNDAQGSFQNISFHKTPPLQKTPNAKKARFPDFDTSNSKQSLAEFLSESFDQVEDTTV